MRKRIQKIIPGLYEESLRMKESKEEFNLFLMELVKDLTLWSEAVDKGTLFLKYPKESIGAGAINTTALNKAKNPK